jgi:sugar O-acyltransferase (sialic acid O-acetyltransferase NeuD family)
MNLVFGASGHAKEIEWLIRVGFEAGRNNFQVDYFVVEDQSSLIEHVGKPVLTESAVAKLTSPFSAFVAIGQPNIRQKIVSKFSKSTVNWPSLIHPSVIYDIQDEKVQLGEGTIIFPNCTLTTNIRIGNHVHINVGSSISHDAVIGDFCTISPDVHLAGNVHLGERVFIGIGAVLLENVSVCAGAIIGAGAVVLKDIVQPGTYVGIPAKQIK